MSGLAVIRLTRLRRNDNVVVLSGKNRGKTGRVLRIMPAAGRAIVEGVNFVRKHTCKLVLIARGIDQARMHADVPSREGKCVDSWIINHEKREFMLTVICLGSDAMTDFVNVFVDLWIFNDLTTASNVAHYCPANLRFRRFAENRVGRTAQVRNLNIVCTGTGDEYDRRYGEKR